jgi:hypothetical protein
MIASCTDQPAALTPEHARLLQVFVQQGFDLAALARVTGRSPLDLLTWSRDPAVQRALADLEALQIQSARLAQASARLHAITELAAVLRRDEAPAAERRHAATVLARSQPLRHIPPAPAASARSAPKPLPDLPRQPTESELLRQATRNAYAALRDIERTAPPGPGSLAERAGLLGESRRPAAANNPGTCPFPKNSSISSTAFPTRSPPSPSASSPSG